MIVTKIITEDRKADINLKNRPFKLFGLMLPSYNNGKWNHTELLFPKENVTEMCFPDEDYDFDEMFQFIELSLKNSELTFGKRSS